MLPQKVPTVCVGTKTEPGDKRPCPSYPPAPAVMIGVKKSGVRDPLCSLCFATTAEEYTGSFYLADERSLS